MEEKILALAPLRLAPRGAGRSIPLGALGQLPIVITGGTNSMRAMVEEAAASIGASFDVRCEVQMPGTAMALAALGIGVAVVPQLSLPKGRLAGLRVLRDHRSAAAARSRRRPAARPPAIAGGGGLPQAT